MRCGHRFVQSGALKKNGGKKKGEESRKVRPETGHSTKTKAEKYPPGILKGKKPGKKSKQKG